MEIFQHMFTNLDSCVFSMALATPDGVTIAAFSPDKERERFPEAMEGMKSSEKAAGGNAIGTCIAEGRAVEIIGAEHYRQIYEAWSCAAAPILDEQECLMAVFNIGQRLENYHAHTFGMVKAASYAISEQMRLRALLRRQESMMELLADGAVIIGSEGQVLAMNRAGARLLGVSPCWTGHFVELFSDAACAEAVLASRVPAHDQETDFLLNSGRRNFIYSLLPIPQSRDVALILREPARMRNLAIKAAGNNASYTFQDILGESDKLRHAQEEAHMVANTDTTVLLLGESGTGKELFAQAIHNASSRVKGPFITINCGAIPRSLLESELFGYESGAFTGARRSGKAGKFELATGGSIFLDEIGELPLDSQVALLRILQNGAITRVGGTKNLWFDVRVIADTNRDLEKMVREGSFREDLFYRLSAYPISIPALRERRGDIIILAHYFLNNMSRKLRKRIEGFSNEALYALEHYQWPGNVRELENIIERLVNIVGSGWISLEMLPEKITRATGATISSQREQETSLLAASVRDTESGVILDTLLKNAFNVRKTAIALGVSRPWLYKKMSRLGVDIASLRQELKNKP